MAKFRNVNPNGYDLDVIVDQTLRRVKHGDVLEVPDDAAAGFAAQVDQPGSSWAAVGAAAKQAAKAADEDAK